MKTTLQMIGVALVSSFLTVQLVFFFTTTPPVDSKETPPPVHRASYAYNLGGTSSAPSNFVEAAGKSIDAVVHVKNTTTTNDSYSPLSYFYGQRSTPNRIGTGSGVIVSPDGYIITNNHVIEGATKIEVTTNNNVRYTANLVGTDPYTDIAVLKITADENLPYLYFGNSATTQIGEWVLAIGNPFNLNSTVTAGIISAKARDLNARDDKNQSFLQTDAAVNPGNSGGALVNTAGELIGINTAITSMSGGFEGYSFAVPSNIARKVFEDLVEYGSTQKGLLGVRGAAISPEYKEQFPQLELTENEGFYVAQTIEGMGAARAGIQEGDVLLKVDQVKIKQFSDLTGYLESKRPGDAVEVLLKRDGKEKRLTVTLEKNQSVPFLRMSLKNLAKEDKKAFGIDKGVLVEDAGPYFNGQIETGSLILDINGERIYSVEDLSDFSPSDIEWITYINPSGEKIRLRL
ncbi:trypsin-like peptidase domain-containing protein [Flavobacteriaceae bacterium]|jgi:serine protease Do|nr:trypsin-like peptidase domain-containing protein [Flavobacteriaceae bacterium]